MVYLKQAVNYEFLSEDMAWEKQAAKEKKRRRERKSFLYWLDMKTRWRLHAVKKNDWARISAKVSRGRILDVGCGQSALITEEHTPYGIEISKSAAAKSNELMRARGGYVVHAPAVEGLEQFEDDFFDGIIMRSYLEHEARPREVLTAAYEKLRPGGYIYVKVPNFSSINRIVRGKNWCGFRFPDHLNYFSKRTLVKLASGVGYTTELINTLTQHTNDNMHYFFRKPSVQEHPNEDKPN